MSQSEIKTSSARPRTQGALSATTTKHLSLYRCLVASASSTRRQMIERPALENGWHTIVCGDVETALHCLRRMLVQLAVVDLDGRSRGTFRDVVREAASMPGLLLVICGNEGDAAEELWARQQGAWLYLPGVSENSDLGLLCSEARHIAERLHKVNDRPARNPAAQVFRPSR